MPSIKINLTYQIAYQLLTVLLPLVSTPYVSRALGPQNMGIHSYTLSIAAYFVLFAMLGIQHHGSRTIAAVRDNERELNQTFSDLFFIHLAFSLLVSAVYGTFVFLVADGYRLLFIIQGLVVLAAALDLNWFFFGMERFKITVTRNTIIKVISLVCIFIFVKTSEDLWKYSLIMALGTFLGQTVIWLFVKQFVSLVWPTVQGMKQHLKSLVVLFVPQIALSIYRIMDKIMLGNLSNEIQVGLYQNAENIIYVPLTLIQAFAFVMIPRMSHFVAKGQTESGKRYTQASMKYIMLLACSASFGLAAVANRFAPLFFGQAFTECGPLLTLLSVTIPFIAFQNVITTQYLLPNKKDKIYVCSLVAGAVINIILNVIFIPLYAARGAVIGTIAAEITVCIIKTIAVRKALPIGRYIKNCVFPLMAGTTMLVLVGLLENLVKGNILGVVLQIVLGATFYTIVNAIYLFRTKDEMFMKQIGKILPQILTDK